MKFGFRVPSFKKRISARTSWKRVARHSLGLKAPRGWGALTNPKKAAYNHVYNRTTVSVDSLLSGGKRHRTTETPLRSAAEPTLAKRVDGEASAGQKSSGGSPGCAVLMFGGAIVGAVASTGLLQALSVATLIVGGVAVAWGLHARRKQRIQDFLAQESIDIAVLVQGRARSQARAAELERAKQRAIALDARFGAEAARAIVNGEYWRGATAEMLIESMGPPTAIKEKVLKTKTKVTYCYRPTGTNRYALKIYLENSIVVGWDEK